MARVRIAPSNGNGQVLEVEDSSIRFFPNYVVVEVLDNGMGNVETYPSRAEMDFRYVETGNISNPATADGAALRAALGSRGDFANGVFSTAGSSIAVDLPTSLLTLPTPDGGVQVTHPSVYFRPDKWNGYRYWMAFTPYDGATVTLENPCILASNDGDTWVVPAGLTNPIEGALAGGAYNSDTHLALGPDNRLYCFWRAYDPNKTGAEETILYRASSDGVNWSDRQTVLVNAAATRRLVSPAVEWDGTQWRMWAIDITPSPNVIVALSAPTLTGTWTTPAAITGTSVLTGRDPWHLDVHRIGGEWVLLFMDVTLNGSDGGALYRAVSRDGLAFTQDAEPFLLGASGSSFRSLYRSCFVPAKVRGVEGYEVFISAAAPAYRIGRTLAQIGTTRPRQDDPINLVAAVGLYPGWLMGDVVNRADSTSSPGAATSGQAWSTSAGTVGVQGKSLYLPTATNSRATIDLGAADAEFGATLPALDPSGAAQQYLIVRFVDANNFIRAGWKQGSWVIETIIGGSATTLASFPGTVLPAANGQRLRVVCKGTTVSLFVNGRMVGTATTTAGQAATVCGIQATNTTVRYAAFYGRTA